MLSGTVFNLKTSSLTPSIDTTLDPGKVFRELLDPYHGGGTVLVSSRVVSGQFLGPQDPLRPKGRVGDSSRESLEPLESLEERV